MEAPLLLIGAGAPDRRSLHELAREQLRAFAQLKGLKLPGESSRFLDWWLGNGRQSEWPAETVLTEATRYNEGLLRWRRPRSKADITVIGWELEEYQQALIYKMQGTPEGAKHCFPVQVESFAVDTRIIFALAFRFLSRERVPVYVVPSP